MRWRSKDGVDKAIKPMGPPVGKMHFRRLLLQTARPRLKIKTDSCDLCAGDGSVCDRKSRVQRSHAGINFRFFDDERRGDYKMTDPFLKRDTALYRFSGDLIHDERLAFDFIAHRGLLVFWFLVLVPVCRPGKGACRGRAEWPASRP